jgi:multiple sugar transport system substrate-binding protein
LAVSTGAAVPDVVFLAKPDEIAAIAANPINYPLALNDLVDKDVLEGFPAGTVSRCTFDGSVYCLSNDIGQTVFWYNAKLFDEWGYEPPATFDEFRDLGDDLARDHPGYILGTANGRYGVNGFFDSSGCPVHGGTVTEVTIDTSATECTRVGDVIGPLLANGTLSTLDLFDQAFTAQLVGGKVVGTIGASWLGPFVFKKNLPGAVGEYAAAPMPAWDGEDVNYSAGVGGGIWVVSRTTQNPEAAVAVALAMTTDDAYAATGPTYPAYGPAADTWRATIDADPWYAESPADVMQEAAGKMNPAAGYVRYETALLESFNTTVIKSGATDMKDALAAWGDQAKQLAANAGYLIKK